VSSVGIFRLSGFDPNAAKSTGKTIIDTKREIIRLVSMTIGRDLMNSQIIHFKLKIRGRKITTVHIVPQITALA
jgi:hypothetical protein